MDYVIKSLENVLTINYLVNIHFFEFEENFATQNEKHSFIELVYVNTGHINVMSPEYTGVLKKGEFILHKANSMHSLSCGKNNKPSIVIIGFICSSADLDTFCCAPTLLDKSNISRLADIIREARNVFLPPYNIPTYDMKKRTKQQYGAEQMLKNTLECFFISIIKNEHAKHKISQQMQSFEIKSIIEYIDNNLFEKITLDELSFMFCTNRTSLCEKFKNVTGKTLLNYICDKKIEWAKKQIRDTNKTFTQISAEMNFDSVHYFSRFFKQKTGISPKEYRKCMQA